MLFFYDVYVVFVIYFFFYVVEDKFLKKFLVYGVKMICLFINKEWNIE